MIKIDRIVRLAEANVVGFSLRNGERGRSEEGQAPQSLSLHIPIF